MGTAILTQTIERFRRGRDIRHEDAAALLDAMIGEADEHILAGVFRAWNEKGIGEDEIYALARVMRDRCTRIISAHARFVDIVGTGGSRSKSFNVSTASAFVVAGAGLPVAKHGNKAATSNSGSADVLAELGIEPAAEAAAAEKCLNGFGICFMFAPNHHRLSPTLGKVRRGLGFPTIFNCVGPLCNPASAPHQLIGVWDRSLVPKMASALVRLGTKRSWIVHGEDGLDEISTTGKTMVAEIDDGTVTMFEIQPEEFGLRASRTDRPRVADAAGSAALIRAVIGGECPGTFAEKMVLINATAALVLAGFAEGPADGLRRAQDSIRNGSAMRKLEQLSTAVFAGAGK